MNIEDLKDQIAEEFSRLAGEIQDSSAFNTLREHYETLPSNVQKLLIGGGVATMVLLILSIPLSFLSSAGTYMTEFEEKRALAKEIIQVSTEVKTAPPAMEALNAGTLRSRLQMQLDRMNLVPEQIAGLSPFDATQGGALASPALQQVGMAVNLKKLNLNQMVDIGAQLQRSHSSLKMTGLEVNANKEDERYMDVTYRLVSYGPKNQSGPNEDKGGRGN